MTAASRSSLSFESPIGRLRVSATEGKLVEVKLGAPELPDFRGDRASDEACGLARQEIEAYLRGELETFSVPYRLMGTPFQRSIWKEMARIPYATTVTYGRLADRAGSEPGSSRAVGAACGANSIPLVVPCHRVLAGSGLGGFSGGIDRKKWLLELEMTRRVPKPLGSSREEREGEAFSAVEGRQQSLF